MTTGRYLSEMFARDFISADVLNVYYLQLCAYWKKSRCLNVNQCRIHYFPQLVKGTAVAHWYAAVNYLALFRGATVVPDHIFPVFIHEYPPFVTGYEKLARSNNLCRVYFFFIVNKIKLFCLINYNKVV